MFLFCTELFEIEVFICIKMDLTLDYLQGMNPIILPPAMVK